MPVRLIALDIDGTLLNSRWEVPETNRVAVAEAARRGIEIALVTGRRYDFAMPVAQQLGVPVTMIVNNGAVVRSHDGATHLLYLLSADTARRVLQLTQEWRDGAALIFDRLKEKQVMLEVLDPNDTLRYGYYARNIASIGLSRPLEAALTEHPIQVMFSGSIAEMAAAGELLQAARFAEEFSMAVTRYESKNFAMIDVLSPIVTKGVALAEWARLRGISREEILAVGDNHNDLEMLRFAGIPVVMGNCVSALTCYGWHQTSSNDEGGVAAAIERFALSEAASCA